MDPFCLFLALFVLCSLRISTVPVHKEFVQWHPGLPVAIGRETVGEKQLLMGTSRRLRYLTRSSY